MRVSSVFVIHSLKEQTQAHTLSTKLTYSLICILASLSHLGSC